MRIRIPTSTVEPIHRYTRSKTPWILDDTQRVYGRLVHYLSGGGMTTFGRTVAQEETRARQRRFLIVAACLSAVWLACYLI